MRLFAIANGFAINLATTLFRSSVKAVCDVYIRRMYEIHVPENMKIRG
jgi:hypothetical protein